VAVAVLYKAVVLESLGDTPGALSWLKKHAARLTALTDQYSKEWQALRKKLGL
jgi:FMN phosphatase YigB (HAD superfamily)